MPAVSFLICRSLLAGDFRPARVAHRLQAGSYLSNKPKLFRGIGPIANENDQFKPTDEIRAHSRDV